MRDLKKTYPLFLAVAALAALFFFASFAPRHQSGIVEIRMTKQGFKPKEFLIREGATVRFVNRDTVWRWPASDAHPTHARYPEFDPRAAIEPGGSWEFTFERGGEFPYHDHLAPYITGTISVVGQN